MTKKRLRFNVLLVLFIMCFIFATAVVTKFLFRYEEIYTVIKDFSSLIIAVSAAYLAYCFQQRQSFLAMLRELWKQMIEAKIALIEYTQPRKHDEVNFKKAYRALSLVIDSVRGVYRNVGETKNWVGYHPFEPLHDMRVLLTEMGRKDVTEEDLHAAERRFIKSWNALRWAFLKELPLPAAPHPITIPDAGDPRRGGQGRRQRLSN